MTDPRKDPREETHFDPEFSRQVRAEIGRLAPARPAGGHRARRVLLAAAGVAALAGVLAAAVLWRRGSEAGALPVAGLQASLERSDFDAARRILGEASWDASPAVHARWRRIATALEREAGARLRLDWGAGFDALAEALEACGKDRWTAGRVRLLRETLDREMAACGILREARALADAGFAAEARAEAERVPADSLYRIEAEALATLLARGMPEEIPAPPTEEPARIDPPRATLDAGEAAYALYQSGKGEEALALLPAGHPAGPGMRAAATSYEAGLRHLTDGDLARAAGEFRAVLAADPVPGGWYAARAAEALDGIRQAARDLVPEWIGSAEARIREERYTEAVGLMRQAAAIDPESARLADLRRTLHAARERLWQEGYILLELDPAKARERWSLLLAILPENDPLRSKIAVRMPKE